jgi:hypothetical protein
VGKILRPIKRNVVLVLLFSIFLSIIVNVGVRIIEISINIAGDLFWGIALAMILFYLACIGIGILKSWIIGVIKRKMIGKFPEVIFEDRATGGMRSGILRGSRWLKPPGSETPVKFYVIWEPIAPFSFSGPRYLFTKGQFRETNRSGFELLLDLANNNAEGESGEKKAEP